MNIHDLFVVLFAFEIGICIFKIPSVVSEDVVTPAHEVILLLVDVSVLIKYKRALARVIIRPDITKKDIIMFFIRLISCVCVCFVNQFYLRLPVKKLTTKLYSCLEFQARVHNNK